MGRISYPLFSSYFYFAVIPHISLLKPRMPFMVPKVAGYNHSSRLSTMMPIFSGIGSTFFKRSMERIALYVNRKMGVKNEALR